MGKDKKQTVTLDPASQEFVTGTMRPAGRRAHSAIAGMPAFGPESFQAFMNPFQSEVVDASRADFDRMRQQASRGAAQEATGAGAFGGSRQAVLEANRLSNVDQQEASMLANLRSQGFGMANQLALRGRQANIMQQLQALRGLNLGLGPTGQEITQHGDLFGDLAGAGLTIGSFFAGGPAGPAAAGSVLPRSAVPSVGRPAPPPAPNLNFGL